MNSKYEHFHKCKHCGKRIRCFVIAPDAPENAHASICLGCTTKELDKELEGLKA